MMLDDLDTMEGMKVMATPTAPGSPPLTNTRIVMGPTRVTTGPITIDIAMTHRHETIAGETGPTAATGIDMVSIGVIESTSIDVV